MLGQTFGEEGVLLNHCPSKYTITVSSEKAEVWMINELEFNKRVNKIEPETRNDLMTIMKKKAKQVYDIFRMQPSWSIVNLDSFSRFYIECNYKKWDEFQMTESDENKQVMKEARVFKKQFVEEAREMAKKEKMSLM